MISGTTSHRIDKIRTYFEDEPYKVGVNGVTYIEKDGNGDVSLVRYVIDNITYESDLRQLNEFNRGNRYINNVSNNSVVEIPTTFYVENLTDQDIFEDKFFIKEENKMGVNFDVKTQNDIFIERQTLSVMELHSRMSEITSVGQMEEYKNGFYRVKKDI